MFYIGPKSTFKGDLMQDKVPLVNNSKKTKKKTTKKKDSNGSSIEKYQYTERILCPRDTKEINALGDRLWAYAQKEDSLNFEDFCADEGMAPSMLCYWAEHNIYFRDQHKKAKLKIGARLDKGFLRKDFEYRCKMTLHNYLDRAKEDDAYEDSRKIKLANEGVTNGETKIIVVNENKSYEEPE